MALTSAFSYVRFRSSVLASGSESEPNATDRTDFTPQFPRLLFWLMVTFLAVGVLARVTRYAVMGSMWGDEAMLGINILERDFAGLTKMLDYMQTAPILFLWSERIAFLSLGSSELALRLLPFLAGTAGLFVFWDFAKRSTTPLAAVLAMGLMAVSRWPVCMAANFKPYAFDLFFAAVLSNLAQRWRSEPTKRCPLQALTRRVPSARAGANTAVFVAGGVSLYLLPVAWAHPNRWARILFVAFNVLMVGTFAANYWLHIHGQLEEQGHALETFMRNYWDDGFPKWDPIGFVKWAALIHTGRLFAYPVGDANGGSVVSFLVFLVGIVAAWRSKSRSILVLVLAPFALNFLAAAMGKYPYGGCCRLSQHLAPAICLMLGIALASLIERFSRTPEKWVRNVVITGVVFTIIGVWQMGVDLASPNRDKISTWARELHRELERHIRPGDRILVVSPRLWMDNTTEWQLCRFGDRLTWGIPDDLAADAPRVWIVCNVDAETDYHIDDEAAKRLSPGRVEVGRAMYCIPKDDDLFISWKFTMICLAKPEHAKDRPMFRISP